jgi:aspartyl-tRNA(Asn)/glutamyl-tRNA(Gln) amidotransferase subunit C
VIDREQVLHVAQLARLRLSDEEVDRMADELSSILGHVDRIAELDLEGVPAMTHVVAVGLARAGASVLREDVPRPSLPPEAILEAAPATQDGGFVVPSPQA